MSDNNTTVTTPEGTAAEQERTFTQAELDSIVKDRLAREKGKYADYEELKEKASKFDEAEEARKSELQKATEKAEALQAQIERMEHANTVRDVRAKVAQELGVPEALLTGEDIETCTAQAQGILEFASKSTYPNVPDGGESHTPSASKQDILGIANEKERLQAIKDNIELFK